MDSFPSKQSLLIAVANPENVQVLKKILAPDYEIRVAHNEDETIRLASASEPPNLILLNDMKLPGDKYEVCKRLKAGKTTKDIPIILVTDPTLEDTEAKGFELGVADYLTTPFKESVVKARIRTHLELKRYRDSLENRVMKRVGDLHEEIQERRDVEDTYRGLVEHARDGIAIIHDLIVKYANPAFCKMLGLAEEELIGAHLKKFLLEEEFTKVTKRYSARIGGINLPRIYKSTVIHADGTPIDVELNVSVIPYGRSLAALVFIRDIREEKAWKYLK